MGYLPCARWRMINANLLKSTVLVSVFSKFAIVKRAYLFNL